MNVVVLVGRLGRDPELRYVPSGAPVANFSIAVDDRPGKDGEKRTNWFNVVAWNKLAEVVVEHLQKGSRIGVRGRLQARKWQDQGGNNRTSVEVVAEDIRFLDSTKRREDAAPAEPEPAAAEESPADDDVPF